MNWKPKHSSLSIIALGFGTLFFFFRKDWMLVPIGMVFWGFLIGSIGDFIHLTWMMLARVLGFINSRVLLSISFFLFLTPIALLMRMLGKGNFQKSLGNKSTSFTNRNYQFSKKDLIQPF